MPKLLTWKDEDDNENGEAIGPMILADAELGPMLGEEDLEEKFGWVTREFARDYAAKRGFLFDDEG